MYYVGQGIAIRLKFAKSGRPVDPDTFDLTIKDPAGKVTHLSKGDLLQNTIGDWQYALVFGLAGEYAWDCITTNPPTATGIVTLSVAESRVDTQ